MRFEEDNVNSQCKHCNYFMSGNLLNYRKNLINKIGLERVERLDMLAEIFNEIKIKFEQKFK